MKREVLHKFALDRDGNIVQIGQAVRAVEYFCPGCKGEFILRQGQIRQRHFSHKNPSPDCTNEGYLHNTFKICLLNIIKERIKANTPLVAEFKCSVCNRTHNCNILNAIKDVTAEFALDACRPDLALFNQSNQIPIIIEIVVTHEPEQNVIDYCEKNSTILITIKLDSMNDLENIEGRIEHPTVVHFSNKAICPIYKQQMYLQKNYILLPSIRIVKGGPRIDRIEAALERKKYLGQKKFYRRSRKSE